MSKILDLDLLTYIVNGSPTTENVQIDTATKKIKLVAGGNLVAKDGVTGQCLFSKLKAIIKASSILISVPLPVREMIHDESMELVNGWMFFDETSLKMVRDCGVAYVNTSGVITDMFACFVTLGTVISGAPYYTLSSATDAATGAFSHPNTGTTFGVNEPVQIYKQGVYDYRSYAKLFLRVQGYTYDESSNVDIGYPALTYKKYNFPISHAVDVNVTVDDSTLDTYTGMGIEWVATTGVYLGTNGPYAYHVTITDSGHTYQQVYSWVQRQLRKTTDIDNGGTNRTGAVTAALVYMDGALLTTKYQAGVGGVHIAGIAAGSYNNVKEYNDANVLVGYPSSVSVECEFDSYLQADTAGYYWIFKTSDYGTPGATPILDSTSGQMKGSTFGNATDSYAYSHTVDVPLTGVALGFDGAKIAVVTSSITATGAKLVFTAGLERWATNP